MAEERRAVDQVEGAYVLAILYTVGFLGLIFCLLYIEIPTNNRELLLTLIGIMSAAELGIIKFFYDGSQGAQKAQIANISRAVRTDAVIQEIAKAAPVTAAAAVAAATGNPSPIPASVDTVNVKADTANVTEQPKV